MPAISVSFKQNIGSGEFLYPWGSYFADGKLYICDRQNDRIAIYVNNQYFSEVALAGLPQGVAADSLGNIYVSDLTGYVWKFNSSGSQVWKISVDAPESLAIDASNVYVISDTEIIRLSQDNGAVNGGFGLYGFADTNLNYPRGIAWLNGELFITDTFNGKVKRFSDTGTYINTTQSSILRRPCGITIFAYNKYIAVTDFETDKVSVYNLLDLSLVSTFAVSGQSAGEVRYPAGISASGDTVYVSDSLNNRISAWSYRAEDELRFTDMMFSAIQGLYPTGETYKMREGMVKTNLHYAISDFFSRFYAKISTVSARIVPDSADFDLDAIEDREKFYGLVPNVSSLDERREAIYQIESYPNGTIPYLSANYITKRLQDAGFDVYIVPNRLEYPSILGVRVGNFRVGGAKIGGIVPRPRRFYSSEPPAGWNTIIANSIKPEIDAVFFDSQGGTRVGGFKVGTAVVGGLSPKKPRELQLRATALIYSNTPINAARYTELRRLVLKLKPPQVVVFDYIETV
jgi:hypothetical protein